MSVISISNLSFTVDPSAPMPVTIVPLLADNTLLQRATIPPGQKVQYALVDGLANPPVRFQLNGITVPFPSNIAVSPSEAGSALTCDGASLGWSTCDCSVSFPSVSVQGGAVDWVVTYTQLSNADDPKEWDGYTCLGPFKNGSVAVTITPKMSAMPTSHKPRSMPPMLLRGSLLDGTLALTHKSGSLLHM
jgi:hypothetical protein